MNNNKRRLIIDLDIHASQDTVGLPNNLDLLNNTPPNNNKLAKKKKYKNFD